MRFIKTAAAVLISIIFSNCAQKADFKEQLTDQVKKHRSVHYKISQKTYYKNQTDTTKTDFEVWAVRGEKNYVWVDNFYRPAHMIYDSEKFYYNIPPKKVTTVSEKYPETFVDKNDWIDLFLHPEKLEETLKIATIADATDGPGLVEVTIRSTEKKDQSAEQIFYYDKDKGIPVRAHYEIHRNGQVFVSELLFSDFGFDAVNLNELKKKQEELLQKYPVEKRDKNTSLEAQMLQKGDKAPLFTGKFYNNGADFKMSDYIGKHVIIVDFWYTHCPPCVRSMPELSRLYETYKSKGLKLFGLNSVDNRKPSLPNLKKFLDKKKPSYDIILTDPSVDRSYKVKAYPSMYVIDKKGEISYIELGFDEQKFEAFKAHLEKLLNE